MAENEVYVKNWDISSIGILENHINEMNVANYYLDMPMIKSLIHERNTFSHKGDFGHACIISGHKGMMGAAILASRACLKAGVGLLSCYIPSCGYEIMQKSLPEAMVICDESDTHINSVPEKVYEFKTLGIGPGLGTNTHTEQAIIELLKRSKANMLIDADALNLLSKNTENYKYINEKHILTPHPGEFKRLVGPWINDYEKIEKQRSFCIKHSCTIVLKGANTSICTPDGKIFFNSTGNPGMSTAGSGDVLSGLITGLLSQAYTCTEAAILGVYIHGLAGDLALTKESHESLIASDIIDYFGKAFKIVSNT
ncbi:MAG TPA: NAD(P)H-hydrate dehydratase [Bacteroidetes bacterium]|nr:NAD(P)H-hydrate dehydratase [Bacteroidota bacterium]